MQRLSRGFQVRHRLRTFRGPLRRLGGWLRKNPKGLEGCSEALRQGTELLEELRALRLRVPLLLRAVAKHERLRQEVEALQELWSLRSGSAEAL